MDISNDLFSAALLRNLDPEAIIPHLAEVIAFRHLVTESAFGTWFQAQKSTLEAASDSGDLVEQLGIEVESVAESALEIARRIAWFAGAPATDEHRETAPDDEDAEADGEGLGLDELGDEIVECVYEVQRLDATTRYLAEAKLLRGESRIPLAGAWERLEETLRELRLPESAIAMLQRAADLFPADERHWALEHLPIFELSPPPTTICPSGWTWDEAVAWDIGSLDRDRTAGFGTHVGGCHACLAVIKEVSLVPEKVPGTADPDRGPARTAPTPPMPFFRRQARERMKAEGPTEASGANDRTEAEEEKVRRGLREAFGEGLLLNVLDRDLRLRLALRDRKGLRVDVLESRQPESSDALNGGTLIWLSRAGEASGRIEQGAATLELDLSSEKTWLDVLLLIVDPQGNRLRVEIPIGPVEGETASSPPLPFPRADARRRTAAEGSREAPDTEDEERKEGERDADP